MTNGDIIRASIFISVILGAFSHLRVEEKKVFTSMNSRQVLSRADLLSPIRFDIHQDPGNNCEYLSLGKVVY